MRAVRGTDSSLRRARSDAPYLTYIEISLSRYWMVKPSNRFVAWFILYSDFTIQQFNGSTHLT
ncbi:MAG: hypothetical protein DME24_10585 [Verrucomicrobia bacterium]|nr:MAG: hypothetical protein DME24_10585 [Verrucomicrobiota bacterium]